MLSILEPADPLSTTDDRSIWFFASSIMCAGMAEWAKKESNHFSQTRQRKVNDRIDTEVKYKQAALTLLIAKMNK